jgi:integrase/recombinase XerD
VQGIRLIPDTMLSRIVIRSSALARHRAAPLLAEREAYLEHLERQGVSRHKQRDASTYLVQVVTRLHLKRLKMMTLQESQRAAMHWQQRRSQSATGGPQSRNTFLRYAKGWLRFHRKLVEPKKWNEPRDKRVKLFARYLKIELGFAVRTIDSRVWSVNRFLSWLSEREIQLSFVSASHVERYLDYLSALGSEPRTIATRAHELQVFFRFVERCRWVRGNVSNGIFGPRIHVGVRCAKGPAWTDVRRMLDTAKGDTLKQCRARSILLLASIYALRTSEITGLRLGDVDFKENVLTVRRGKNYLTQRFPMSQEVQSALREFINNKRPACDCPEVFLTLKRPYRRIHQASVYNVTQNYMNRLGIKSTNRGAHSLRHACATHLLEVGTPIKKVASLLGHSSTKYVAHYVQHSTKDLIPVADFRLRDLWN